MKEPFITQNENKFLCRHFGRYIAKGDELLIWTDSDRDGLFYELHDGKQTYKGELPLQEGSITFEDCEPDRKYVVREEDTELPFVLVSNDAALQNLYLEAEVKHHD